MKYYRTGWISDVHLGTRGSKAVALLQFLRETEFETLYIVGDLIDIWALRRAIYWPQEHNDVIQKILRKGRKGTDVIYIIGNHDEFLRRFQGNYGNMTLQKNAVHLTADGRRLLIIHGDELDTVIHSIGWLAHLGDIGYQLLLRCNGPLNFFRRRLGLGYWSLSAYVKAEVKNVVSFIGQFEEAIVRYARDYDVDGVLCGHIHTAAVREIGGVTYYNTGDWVESCTAIVERYDGAMELLKLGQETAVEESTARVLAEYRGEQQVRPVPMSNPINGR
ncbi:MAG TPA: UDP-2,3-diacylglucosamine diphosphatase [Terrimicrobiaceae bacterium]